MLPDTHKTNLMLGGQWLHGSNIIFTNGEEDPWKWATLLKRTPDMSETIVPREIKCENCAHCVELYTPRDDDAQDLKNAREEIRKHVDQWLNGLYQTK